MDTNLIHKKVFYCIWTLLGNLEVYIILIFNVFSTTSKLDSHRRKSYIYVAEMNVLMTVIMRWTQVSKKKRREKCTSQKCDIISQSMSTITTALIGPTVQSFGLEH